MNRQVSLGIFSVGFVVAPQIEQRVDKMFEFYLLHHVVATRKV